MESTKRDAPSGFLCYARADDNDGHLTRLRAQLEYVVQGYGAADFRIFQDTKHLPWGKEWEQERNLALEHSVCLLPIITPRFFQSEQCRLEVERFLEREARLGRDDLILPIYYIDAPEWEDDRTRHSDPLVTMLRKRHRSDWRRTRLESFDSSAFRAPMDECGRKIYELIGSVMKNPGFARNGSDTVATSAMGTNRVLGKPFPELRGNFIASLTRKLLPLGNLHIICFSGARGVGKTHLCESLASILARDCDARTNTFNIVRNSQPFHARVADSLFPAIPVHAPAELATLLVEDSRRRVIHISNCQDLSGSDIHWLASLFTELESRRWGMVQFLLESRPQNDRSDWHKFIKQICNNLTGCREIPVNALRPNRIIQVIDSLFLTLHAQQITQALVGKAGGKTGVNPLFLVNIIQYMITQGAFQWKEHDDREYLIVEDFDFMAHLRELPDELRPLLRERIEQYEQGDDSRDTRLPYAERLALLAAVGPDFDRARVAQALGVTMATLHRMDLQLVNDDFLKYVGVDERVDFGQEIMRLAAEDYGREAMSFWSVAERLIEVLDQKIPREQILAGVLYRYLQHDEKAQTCFRITLQGAKEAGDYPLQRVALSALTQAAEPQISEPLETKQEWIEWLVDLGWNEMQSGSQAQALRYFERARHSAFELLDHGGYEEERLLRTEDAGIRQRKLTCLLTRQRIKECLDLLEVLVPEIEDPKQLFDTLNRFLLLCFTTGQAGAGFHAAQLGWVLAESLDMESRSVIMSDIGHLFLLESPADAINFWEGCLEAAQEVRQLTHAQTNLLIADILSGARNRDEEALSTLLKTIQTHTGTSVQLARVYMYAGAREAIRGNWEQARVHFELARSNATLSGQVSYEWEADNNLGVTYLALNEQKLARRSFALAASRAHSLLTECDPLRIASLFSSFEDQAKRLFDSPENFQNNEVSQLKTPRSTGSIWYLLHNLHQLERTLQPSLPKNFWRSVDQVSLEASSERIASDSNPILMRTRLGALTLALA